MVVWDRKDYLLEAERQLNDSSVYNDAQFKEKLLVNLVEKSNNMFRKLGQKSVLSEKESKYFTYQYRKPTNLEKLPKV